MFLAGLLILVTAGAGDPLQDAPHRIVKDLAQRTVLQLGGVNRFVLECRASATPVPTYTWYRDGELLTEERLQQLDIKVLSLSIVVYILQVS